MENIQIEVGGRCVDNDACISDGDGRHQIAAAFAKGANSRHLQRIKRNRKYGLLCLVKLYGCYFGCAAPVAGQFIRTTARIFKGGCGDQRFRFAAAGVDHNIHTRGKDTVQNHQ